MLGRYLPLLLLLLLHLFPNYHPPSFSIILHASLFSGVLNVVCRYLVGLLEARFPLREDCNMKNYVCGELRTPYI